MNLQHIYYWDYLKALAIIMVVVGHIISNCMRNGFYSPINTILYSVHMPLFLFLSGCFIKQKDLTRFFFLNLLTRFVIPYIVWCMILITFYQGSELLYQPLKETISIFISQLGIVFLWFIKAYLIAFVLWQFLYKFSPLNKLIVGFLILGACNYTACIFDFVESIKEMLSLSLYCYVFIASGSYLKKLLFHIYSFKRTFYLFIGSTIGYIILMQFYENEYNYFTSSFSMMYTTNKWYIFPLRFFIGIFACLCLTNLILTIKHISTKESKNNFIAKIGQNTLSIYLLQSLVVEAFMPRILHLPSTYGGYFIAFIIGLFVVAFSTLFILFTHRFSWSILLWGSALNKIKRMNT